MAVSTYAEILRDAIRAAHTSRTKLSFALADKTGNTQKTEYRALGKYLAGTEIPSPDRAAILAVLLADHRLALVNAVAERRRARQAELEAAVDRIDRILETLVDRVEALEHRAEREDRPKRAQ